jgi:predicted amidohydrolase
MTLRIALAQFDFPVGAIASNAEQIGSLIARARDVHGAQLVVFPELCVSGYSPEDLLLRPQFLADCAAAVTRLAAQVHGITAVVGWPEAAGAVVYNAASVLRDGRIEATYRKRDLPNHAVFDERRYFEVDPDGGVCVFDVGGVPVGLLICQDLWGLEPMHETAAAGAALVVVPNASPFERDKHAERDALLAERAAGAGCAIAYVNVVGGQDDTVFDGASLLADADGRVHPAATSFTAQLLVADFDAKTGRFDRASWPTDADESTIGLMYRAMVCGTRDYCRKNGFDKVWLGLSGGIDSRWCLQSRSMLWAPRT